jgi:predicted dehydrogenase
MSDRRLRVGLIGLGNVAIGHLEGYRGVQSIEVVAAAEPRQDRLTEFAERYGFTPYQDYQQMLERERLDIACVLTPVNTHRAVTEAVAAHGVHVLCEKPIAINLADAQAMITACRAAGVELAYGASYQFLPPVVAARELIAAGRLGRVELLTESWIGGDGADSYEPMGFVHYPEGGPGGSGWGLVDHGIHFIGIFPWLLDSKVVSVYGRGNISGAEPGVEYAILHLENGAVGHLLYNDRTFPAELPTEGVFSWAPDWYELVAGERPAGARWQVGPQSIRVFGTEGSLRVLHYANALYLTTAAGQEQLRVDDRPLPNHFGAQIERFAERIRAGDPSETGGEVGFEALAVLLALYRSAEQRRVVEVEEIRTELDR